MASARGEQAFQGDGEDAGEDGEVEIADDSNAGLDARDDVARGIPAGELALEREGGLRPPAFQAQFADAVSAEVERLLGVHA